MEGLIMAAQLLLALTILVGLHEFGHFIFARIFNIRVNKFYIFFDFLFPLPDRKSVV
jgi:regulator of sigma E protease